MKIKALLLVEDNPIDADETQRKLKRSKVQIGQIMLAQSLAEALKAIATHEFEVVLLDLDLADSKNLETIKAVRRATDIAIVALSDYEDEILGVEALKVGADSFLIKALMTEESLEEAIKKSITRQKIRVTTKKLQEKIDALANIAKG